MSVRGESSLLAQLEEQGFVEVGHLLDPQVVAEAARAVEAPLSRPTGNGELGYVPRGPIRYLSCPLTWGRAVIDLYTAPGIIGLVDRWLGEPCHLSTHKIYRHYATRLPAMAWHDDNNRHVWDPERRRMRSVPKVDERSAVLIVYLSDVRAGGLSLAPRTHRSRKRGWWRESDIDASSVVTFDDRPRGTAILFDDRLAHRPSPFARGPARTSLYAQYAPVRTDRGESVLLDARDIAGLDATARRVLKFGAQPAYAYWPAGDAVELYGAREWLAIGGRLARSRLGRVLAAWRGRR